MAKHEQTHKGVEYVHCRSCGHGRPITPNMKIEARGANCQRCGEPMPELQQYVVEKPKPEQEEEGHAEAQE